MIFKSKKDYYKDTAYFHVSQPNPTEAIGKGKKGDCVIRALAHVLGCTWTCAFDMLVENAREIYDVPNHDCNYEDLFSKRGYIKTTYPAVKGKKRMTAEQFAKEHPVGRYFVLVANHATACIDGKIWDSWNPANKCVYKAWEIKNEF